MYIYSFTAGEQDVVLHSFPRAKQIVINSELEL